MKHPQTTAPNPPAEAAEESFAVERPAAAPDPFDVASLRLAQDFAADIGVQRVLTHVPVRRPNRQDFIRVRQGEDYRLDTTVITLREDNETYLSRLALIGAPACTHRPIWAQAR